MSNLMWRYFIDRYECINSYRRCKNEQAVIEQKKQIVVEIADKLKASKSTIVVDYRGLNVAEVN